MCALQRPLDDRSQLRIRLEAEAVLAILSECRAGEAELCSSDALVFEADQNPHPLRRAYAHATLAEAYSQQELKSEVQNRATELVALGLKLLDALHLTSAEEAGANVFCTCDDRLLKRSRNLAIPPLRVFSPLELAQELNV